MLPILCACVALCEMFIIATPVLADSVRRSVPS